MDLQCHAHKHIYIYTIYTQYLHYTIYNNIYIYLNNIQIYNIDVYIYISSHINDVYLYIIFYLQILQICIEWFFRMVRPILASLVASGSQQALERRGFELRRRGAPETGVPQVRAALSVKRWWKIPAVSHRKNDEKRRVFSAN